MDSDALTSDGYHALKIESNAVSSPSQETAE